MHEALGIYHVNSGLSQGLSHSFFILTPRSRYHWPCFRTENKRKPSFLRIMLLAMVTTDSPQMSLFSNRPLKKGAASPKVMAAWQEQPNTMTGWRRDRKACSLSSGLHLAQLQGVIQLQSAMGLVETFTTTALEVTPPSAQPCLPHALHMQFLNASLETTGMQVSTSESVSREANQRQRANRL